MKTFDPGDRVRNTRYPGVCGTVASKRPSAIGLDEYVVRWDGWPHDAVEIAANLALGDTDATFKQLGAELDDVVADAKARKAGAIAT